MEDFISETAACCGTGLIPVIAALLLIVVVLLLASQGPPTNYR